jgi:GAF domain-containing protein
MADPRPAPPATPNKDLNQVNEKLRELIASLKSARERHESAQAADAGPQRQATTPPPSTPEPPSDDLRELRESLARATAERDDLRERLGRAEEEMGRISDDYVLVQEQSSELAQLYVALERLHGGLTREETLQAIQEIIINVVGSEEFALFERVEDRLALVHHFGVDPVPLRELKLGDGVIGRTAQKGKLFVAGRDGPVDASDADVSAAIPLLVGDRVWGVLTVFRLLGHKPVLGESDQVVFELIRSHAGIALSLRPTDGAAPRA